MSYETFTISMKELSNIVNACTEHHVSNDYLLDLLCEFGIVDNSTSLPPVAHITTSTPSQTPQPTTPSLSPRPSCAQANARKRREYRDNSESSSNLAASFTAMRLSPPSGEQERRDIVGADSDGTNARNSRVTTPPSNAFHGPVRSNEHSLRDISYTPDRSTPLPPPGREIATQAGLAPTVPKLESSRKRVTPAARWYCVTSGEEVGAVLGW